MCGPPCILRESLKSRLGVEELGNWAAGWIVINASNNPLLPINRPGARPMDLWAGRPSVPSKHAPHYQPLCTGVGTGIPLNNATYIGLCVLSVALILSHLPFNTLQPHLHKGTSVHQYSSVGDTPQPPIIKDPGRPLGQYYQPFCLGKG